MFLPQEEVMVAGHGPYAGLYSTARVATAKGHPLAAAAAGPWAAIDRETVLVVRLAEWADAQGLARVVVPCHPRRSDYYSIQG